MGVVVKNCKLSWFDVEVGKSIVQLLLCSEFWAILVHMQGCIKMFFKKLKTKRKSKIQKIEQETVGDKMIGTTTLTITDYQLLLYLLYILRTLLSVQEIMQTRI